MVYPTQDEVDAVDRVEQAMAQYGPFVSLAEAARQTGVPLSSLADAVRHERIPAIRMQKQRWLVRISAVQGYFNKTDSDPTLVLDQKLKAKGLLDENFTWSNRTYRKVKPVSVEGDKPVSETIIEERR